MPTPDLAGLAVDVLTWIRAAAGVVLLLVAALGVALAMLAWFGAAWCYIRLRNAWLARGWPEQLEREIQYRLRMGHSQEGARRRAFEYLAKRDNREPRT